MTQEEKKQKVDEMFEQMVQAINKGDYKTYNAIRNDMNAIKCTIKYGKE